MILNPQIIEKDGKKVFAVLPYKEFLKLREELDDYEDLRCLRAAKADEEAAPTIGLADLRKRLRRRTGRSSRPS